MKNRIKKNKMRMGLELEALKTDRGGYTRKTLELLGETWPPKKGWKQRVLNDPNRYDTYLKNLRDDALPVAEKSQRGWDDIGPFKPPPDRNSNKYFYSSDEWRALRVDVLEAYECKCMMCGRSPKRHGIVVHVDHIYPRSTHPNLELEFNNLQILCEDCNKGKSNWYETDWRPNK